MIDEEMESSDGSESEEESENEDGVVKVDFTNKG
jgi:hypothetical protein